MAVPLLDLKRQFQEIEGEIKETIEEVLESQRFILGPQVKQFEEEIASYCGTRYAVGVASGSDALLLALRALGVGLGDEVVTSSFSFFASAGSISRTGARPVFLDIDPETFNIDPSLIEAKISERTKVILPVYLFGQCADMDPILELARRYNLAVVEDAAQAIGSEYKGKRAGSIGALGCFSFFPSKNLGGYGDGGMVTTDDEELAEKVEILRKHGGRSEYNHSMIGYNSRLDALQAAILRVKLKHLDRWTSGRQENAAYYDQELAGLDGVKLPRDLGFGRHIYNQYTLRVKKRDELKEHLKEKGIGCKVYYPLPLPFQDCYRFLGYKEGDMPEAESAAQEVISIPIFPELSREEKEEVVGAISSFYEGDSAVST